MALAARQPWLLASALLVPWLTLASPGWLRLAGVAPAWAVLWLLPWALVDGRLSGCLAGLGLGLLLDGLVPGPVSQIPALMFLGWWFGRIGRRSAPIQRSFSLALLALCGTALLDLSLMLQWVVRSWLSLREALSLETFGGGLAAREGGVNPALLAVPGWHGADLAAAGLHVLLAQTLITALLAPMICSLQLLLWRQLNPLGRG
jgi:rod shape-determining protein MreD